MLLHKSATLLLRLQTEDNLCYFEAVLLRDHAALIDYVIERVITRQLPYNNLRPATQGATVCSLTYFVKKILYE